MTLTFKTLPLSTNQLYGRGKNGVYVRKEAREAKEAIGWEARVQYRGQPLAGSLTVSVAFFFPTRHHRDVDNLMKSFLDSLTGIVWNDDSQISNLVISKSVDRANPRVEMTVSDADVAQG